MDTPHSRFTHITIGLKGISLTEAVRFKQIGVFSRLDDIKWLFITGFVGLAVTDTAMAIILCYLLRQMKNGVRRTSFLIDTLMRFTVQTGALTSVCGICVPITYATMPNNFVFVGFYLLLPKLYHNALLVSLNAREALITAPGTDGYHSTIHLTHVVAESSSDPSGRQHSEKGDSNIARIR
ncbi:hypothetical protein ABKN59_004920 [Abortiporus biennis]